MQQATVRLFCPHRPGCPRWLPDRSFWHYNTVCTRDAVYVAESGHDVCMLQLHAWESLPDLPLADMRSPSVSRLIAVLWYHTAASLALAVHKAIDCGTMHALVLGE